MDIVVKGRKVDVSDRFRQHAIDKLSKVERLDHRIIRLEVELSEERNPRQSDIRQRVEVTCVSKGPVIRAEAAASDPFGALDVAVNKLEGRLRRAADKRRVHHGLRTPESLHSTAPVVEPVTAAAGTVAEGTADGGESAPEADAERFGQEGEAEQFAPEGENGFVVREKTFESRPMTLDEALFQMELVGHDFFLFADADTGLASVVYRRKGYDYGVIRLKQ